MSLNQYANDVISLFAIASEELNKYAQALRQIEEYKTVCTGTDVRNYDSGWRLEKWVEIVLNEENGRRACLWLELGFQNGTWTIGSSLSISHSDFHFEFPEKKATTLEDLENGLTRSVADLTDALKSNDAFAKEVQGLTNK